MNLIEEFEKKSPDKVIETIISKIFFLGQKVFKVYKYEKFFFGDFSLPESRADFYKEDFYWNNLMAPEIYTHLRPAGDDFYFEMKKFDDNNNLTNLLLNKKISDDDLRKIVREMVLRLKKLTENRRQRYAKYFGKKLMDIHLEDLESDRNLMAMISEKLDIDKIDDMIGRAKEWCKNSLYYQNFDSANLSCLIDNHADNIILENGKVQFFDVLPPKETWRVGDLNFVACRMASDAAVLYSPKKAEIIYNEFEKMGGFLPKEIRAIYQMRSALIQAWCFYSAGRPEVADRYIEFALDSFSCIG